MLQTHQILLVEDHSEIARAARTFLKSEAFRLIEATSSARQALAASDTRASFLLLDLAISQPIGFSTILRPRRAQVPLLLLRGRPVVEHPRFLVEQCCNGVVAEPFYAPALALKIRQVLLPRLDWSTSSRALALAGLERRPAPAALRSGDIPLTAFEFHVLESVANYAALAVQSDPPSRDYGRAAEEVVRTLNVCVVRLANADGAAERDSPPHSYRLRLETLDAPMH